MQLATRQPGHRIEPLEPRKLFSAHSSAQIEVMEIGVVSDDDDVVVSITALPTIVQNTIHRFVPNTAILHATLSEDEGTEYGISAIVNGRRVGIIIAPNGQIVETEEVIALDDLPQQLIDWVKTSYGQARIDRVKQVTSDGIRHYEMQFTPPGQPEIEAAIQLKELNEIPVIQSRMITPPISPMSVRQDEMLSIAPAAFSNEAIVTRDTTPIPTDIPIIVEQNIASRVVIPSIVDRYVVKTNAEKDSSPNKSKAEETSWFRHFAAFALSKDGFNFHQRLSEIQTLYESMSQRIAGTAESSVMFPLALLAAFAAGAQVRLVQFRRARRGPVLFSTSGGSSWSWMIGSATHRRPRRSSRHFEAIGS